MADVLKQTLYITADLTFVANADVTLGVVNDALDLSVAGSHDASDATLGSVEITGDNIDNGDGFTLGQQQVTTCTVADPISFVRYIIRGKRYDLGTAGTRVGTARPYHGSAQRGSPHTFSTSYADYSQDFTTKPAGGAWTSADINAESFGLYLHATEASADKTGSVGVAVSEFYIEVWGPEVELKQTLFITAALPFADNTQGAFLENVDSTNLSAADSHDSNDATLGQLGNTGDTTSLHCNAGTHGYASYDACTYEGTISFVRLVLRAKKIETGPGPGTASVQALCSSGAFGDAYSIMFEATTSWASYQDDLPLDGSLNPWTAAGLNDATSTAGLDLYVVDADDTFSTTVTAQVSEFRIEVWGPVAEVQTSTPASVAGTGSLTVATVVIGAVLSVLSSVSCTGSLTAATAVAGGVSSTPASVAGTGQLSAPNLMYDQISVLNSIQGIGGATTATPLSGEYAVMEASCIGYGEMSRPSASYSQADASAIVSAAHYIDLYDSAPTSTLATTIRSNTSPYYDQSTGTKTLHSSPGTWPNSGTLTFSLGGLHGSTSIDGFGGIAGVVCYAIIRAAKDGGTLSNFRFDVMGQSQVLASQPSVNALPVNTSMWVLVESPMITQTVTPASFVWGQGSESLFTRFVGWSFKADYAVTTSGHFAQCEVAEAWIEAYTSAGFMLPQMGPFKIGAPMGGIVRAVTMNPDTEVHP